MSDAMSFAQFEDQTVELLPARTVLSLMSAATLNNPVPIGGDHPMYDTWMNTFDLLGLPHPYDPSM